MVSFSLRFTLHTVAEKLARLEFRENFEMVLNVLAQRRFGIRWKATLPESSASTTTARTPFSQYGKEFMATRDLTIPILHHTLTI
jgi:hypothetical protein